MTLCSNILCMKEIGAQSICDECGSITKREKPLSNRKRMYTSNAMIKNWLLQNGYDHIWFKRHTKRNDLVYSKKGNYLATDLWNLFDGMCFDRFGRIIFLQMKTNAWPAPEPFERFVKHHPGTYVLVLNCSNKLKECQGKWKVFVRSYK